MIQIDNLDIRPLFYWTREEHGSSGIWGGHISLRNTDRPGWASAQSDLRATLSADKSMKLFSKFKRTV